VNSFVGSTEKTAQRDLVTLQESLQILINSVERQRAVLDQLDPAQPGTPQADLHQSLGEMATLLPRLFSSVDQFSRERRAQQRERGELAALFHVTQVVNSSLDLNQVLNQVMDQIVQLTKAERGFLMLINDDGELEFKVARNMDRTAIEGSSFSISRTIVQQVAEQGQPVVTTNARQDPRFRFQESVVSYKLRSILCVPLRVKDKVTGVIYVDNRIKSGIFGDHHREPLTAFANQAAIAIENARLFEEINQALARERRLNQVTRIISSALNLPTILQSVARLAVELVTADMGAIALLAPDTGTPTDFYLFNFPEDIKWEPPTRDQGLLWHILETGKSLLLPDYSAHPRASQQWVAAGVRSFLGVPILAGETPVGALGLFSTAAQKRFDRRDQALAASVGRQAGVAIQNARLFEAERRQLEELTVLHAVALAGAEATSEDALIERTTQVIGDTLYPDTFGVLLLDETKNALILHPSYRARRETKRLVIPVGQGITGMVVRDGQPRRIADVTQESTYISAGEQTRSELCVPLKAGDRILGVINAENTQHDAFSEADERLLMTIAGQLATAIEKVRLFEAERRRRQEAETLRKATAALTSALDINQVLDGILVHLKQVIPYNSAALFLLQGEWTRVVAARGSEDVERVLGQDFPADNALFREMQRTQQPLCLADAQADPRFQGWGDTRYVRGWMGAPLVVRGKVIGYLTVDSQRVDAYGEAEIALARALANQAAVAIENARLFFETQRRAEELATALERQEELDRLKSEFIQNVSHELRTPLAIIRGYTELLENDELGKLQADQHKAISIIARRSYMLTRLVDDFATLQETETKEIRRERVNLAGLAHAMLADFEIAAREAELSLTAEVPSDLILVYGIPAHLQRMLDNLLTNAVKFTPAGGSVAVRIWQEKGNVILEVADTGVGIPSDQLERIFERFYQIDGSTTRRYGGTGLGLALVKEVVEAHSGQVTVKSTLGQGSTFRVTLPGANLP